MPMLSSPQCSAVSIPFTGDADPNCHGYSSGCFLSIRGVDQFGNEADIDGGEANAADRQYLN